MILSKTFELNLIHLWLNGYTEWMNLARSLIFWKICPRSYKLSSTLQSHHPLSKPIYHRVVSLLSMAIFVSKIRDKVLAGIVEANISRTLEKIRDISGFRDLTSIVWDTSDTISLDSRKKSFFFRKGLQVKASQKI